MQVRILPGPLPPGRLAACQGARSNGARPRAVDTRRRGSAQGAPVESEGTLSREKLKALEELQRIDLQIRDLNAQAEGHPLRLKQIEAERNSARQALDTVRGKLADNERARRQNEQLL